MIQLQKAYEVVDDPYYTAIKYPDGRSECYRNVPVVDLNLYSSQSAGNICMGTIRSYNFPVGLFIEAPVVNATYVASDGYMAFIYGINKVSADGMGDIYLGRLNTATLNGYVSFRAVGRWK